MTVADAVKRVDNLYPNTFLFETKALWLGVCDSEIKKQGYMHTENYSEDFDIKAYLDDTTSLLLPKEFYSIYDDFLAYKICYSNGEFERANNFLISYNHSVDELVRFIRHSNKPVTLTSLTNVI